MSDESDLREFLERVQVLKRETAQQRTRWAALQKTPGGAPQLTALLKRFEPLLAALDNLGKPASTTNPYDRIRAEAARQPGAHPDLSIPLEQRLER